MVSCPYASVTARQVYSGLAGLLIVSDEQEQALNLPSGDLEVPLVIQDRSFEEHNQLSYSSHNLLPKELGNKRNSLNHSLLWDQGMRNKRFNIILSSPLFLIATLAQAATHLPPTAKVDMGPVEEVCC